MTLDIESNKNLQNLVNRSLDKIKESKVFMTLLTSDAFNAPEVLLQTGIAVLHDKPIALIVERGVKIPYTLQKISAAIEFFDPENRQSIHDASMRVMDKLQMFFRSSK